MSDYTTEEKRNAVNDMANKIYDDQYSITEEELIKDSNWIEASKDVYKELEGQEWSGSDEDLAKEGLNMMSRFNFNLSMGTINYTRQLKDADDKTKMSFYYLIDTYDKKDISKNGVLRAFKEIGLDPMTYIGIGSFGFGFAGKQATTQVAKKGLKEMLKEGAKRFVQSPTAVAATESAIYSGADDIARQEAAIGAGVQDEFSPEQTAAVSATGAALGAGLVKGASKAAKLIKKGEDGTN